MLSLSPQKLFSMAEFIDVCQTSGRGNLELLCSAVMSRLQVYIASFPAPAQPFVTCSTEKWGGPGKYFLMWE